MTTPDNPPSVSEAAKVKAEALAEAECAVGMGDKASILRLSCFQAALARYVQEVSDALKAVNLANTGIGIKLPESLGPFILPDPVDPLEEVTRGMIGPWTPEALRGRLAKRGLKIVESGK